MVQVRKAGQSHTASFPNKVAAQEWATKVEADILAGKLGRVPDKTFGELLDRYMAEVTVTKRGAQPETLRIKRVQRDEIADVKLADLSPAHFAAWRDRRLRNVSAASVLREITTLSHACTVAVKEWRWLQDNPLSAVRRPEQTAPRQRVITDDEVERLLLVCGDDLTTHAGRVGAALLFALETAMRAGEICALTWQHVHDKHVHLPKTKNGSARDVPLSPKAKAILADLRAAGCRQVFDLTPGTLDTLFRKMKGRALVKGCTFHDSRRTALTRLARVFPNPLDLARISGHRDLSLLSRVYYAPSIDDLACKLL